MEPIRIGALPLVMEHGESHNQGVHSNFTEGSIGSFDELLLFDDSEFNKYNLPVLPSLRLSPPPLTGIGIDDTVAMAAAINSLSSEESTCWGSMQKPEESALGHARSLSVDSGFIAINNANANDVKKSNGKGTEESEVDHCHRQSRSAEVGNSSLLVKRAMSPEKLAELAKVDPKKAKRILANRKSAAKSKERKANYVNELKERVKRLQAQSDNISEQLAIYERNTEAMAARNNQSRMQLEAKQQELQHRLAHNEALKKEIHYYRMKTSQFAAEMADDPSYAELLSKFSSQLALPQLPTPPPQHQVPLQLSWHPDGTVATSGPHPYLPKPSYGTNEQVLSGFDQDSYNLPPLPPSIPAPSLPFDQPFNELYGGPSSFSNFNQLN